MNASGIGGCLSHLIDLCHVKSKAEAKILYIFLHAEKERHLLDVAFIEEMLDNLTADWELTKEEVAEAQKEAERCQK
jgi:hypothetical protein